MPPLVCSKEEYLNTLHSSIADRSPEVRRDVVERIGSETKQGELTQDIATALTELLHDDDKRVRVAALGVLSRREAYAQELEEMAVELSRDPEVSEAMIGVLARMRPIGAKAAERLVQMFDGGYNAYQLFSEGTHYGLSDDAKAIVRRFALRILTESVEPYDRWMAWRTLIRIGDDSILPQLEELALSDNREGIEERLTGLIAHIRLNYVELPQMKEGYAVLDPDTHISEHTWHMEPWHPYSAK